ncbi:MAG: hypothetical protein K9L75_05505 [Spirochaetia bacterium]|nr:hypothetical protein [Spirochaetia bacterium]
MQCTWESSYAGPDEWIGRCTRPKRPRHLLADEQSDLFIVVRKPVKIGGAKGETSQSISSKKHSGYWSPGENGK